MSDDVILDTGASISMQVDIQEAYVMSHIVSIDYGFKNVINNEDLPDLETPTECDKDEEKVREGKADCSSEASLHNKEHKDHDDNIRHLLSTDEDDDIEVDYEFHNDAAFVHTELGLKEEDVEESKG